MDRKVLITNSELNLTWYIHCKLRKDEISSYRVYEIKMLKFQEQTPTIC